MSIGELCSREVVVVNRDEPICEAVRLMRQHHIGDVIELAAEQLSGLARLVRRERMHEQQRRP